MFEIAQPDCKTAISLYHSPCKRAVRDHDRIFCRVVCDKERLYDLIFETHIDVRISHHHNAICGQSKFTDMRCGFLRKDNIIVRGRTEACRLLAKPVEARETQKTRRRHQIRKTLLAPLQDRSLECSAIQVVGSGVAGSNQHQHGHGCPGSACKGRRHFHHFSNSRIHHHEAA